MRQAKWSGIYSSLRIFHPLLGSTQTEALVSEADVFSANPLPSL